MSNEACTLHPSVLQEFQGADASAGREPAGLQRGPQGEAPEEERAQAEDHPGWRRGHRAGAAEQGTDRAVAEGDALIAQTEGQRQHPGP